VGLAIRDQPPVPTSRIWRNPPFTDDMVSRQGLGSTGDRVAEEELPGNCISALAEIVVNAGMWRRRHAETQSR
jgi:hypothetical protein